MLEFVGALIGSAAVGWIAAWLELIPWRRARDAHWTERARRLYPARIARVQNVMFVALLATLVCFALFRRASWLMAAEGGLLGALAVGFAFEREINPDVSMRSWLHVMGATLVTQFLRIGLFVGAVFSMPRHFSGRVWCIALVYLATQLALQFGFGLRLLRWLRVLRPAPPRLVAIVDDTCARLGVSIRGVWELTLTHANAMAFVTTRELAFTTKLLAIAPDDELKAICAHELGHISESRWTMMGRVAGALSIFPLVFVRPAEGDYGEVSVFALLLLMLLFVIGRARLGRAMEKRADKIAVHSADDDAVYARALERIYRANQMPAVMRKSSIRLHPDLYDRMVAANVTPEYPRPAPPRRIAWSSMVLLGACIVTAVVIAGAS